jgi:DnaK suppressor protein
MTAKHLHAYRNLLLQKRAEMAKPATAKKAATGLEAVRMPDFVDQSVQSLEESVQVRIRQTDSKLLKAIDAALHRIERGAFGICEMCGREIPAARLKAVPWARQCRDCKEQQDTGEPRPEKSLAGA